MRESEVSEVSGFGVRNFRCVLEYWGPITIVLSFLAAGVGIFTLYVFTLAIGRVDLFLVAMDASSALAIWMFIVVLIVVGYLFALTVTTWFYGVAISLFGNISNKSSEIAFWLLFPILSGFAAFVVLIFFFSSDMNARLSLVIVCGITVIAYGLLFFSERFRGLARDNFVGVGKREKMGTLAFQCLAVCAAVILSAIPALIILNSYVGEDTSDAINFVAVLTFATLVLSLAPAFIFYASRGTVFWRAVYGVVAACVLLILFLLFSKGTMSTITYAAASNLQIRQSVPARFILADDVRLSDFDSLQWRTRLHDSKRVEIEAFPLFSLGDVLLLCPSDYAKLKLHELPDFSPYCFSTLNSKVIRKALRPKYSSGRESNYSSWQRYAEEFYKR